MRQFDSQNRRKKIDVEKENTSLSWTLPQARRTQIHDTPSHMGQLPEYPQLAMMPGMVWLATTERSKDSQRLDSVRILKVSERRRQSTLHRNPPPPQLEYTSYHSWAALIIGRRYGMPFAASTSTSLSIHIQPAQAEDGRGPLSSYTGLYRLCLEILNRKYVISLKEVIFLEILERTLVLPPSPPPQAH